MMNTNFLIFTTLLRRDLKATSKGMLNNMIDTCIIVLFTYIVYGHLMPKLGMSTANIGPIFLGVIVLVLNNIIYDRALRDAMDLQFTRFIDYQITLPISNNWLLAKYVVSYSIDLLLASFPVYLFGRLLYGQLLDFQGNFFLFLSIYLLVIVVLSTLFMLEAFAVSFSWFRENTFARLIVPATLLGCIYYPWLKVHTELPTWSIIFLLSPITYMVEAFRAVMIDQSAYIPLWISVTVLLGLLVTGLIALWVMFNKRLDLV